MFLALPRTQQTQLKQTVVVIGPMSSDFVSQPQNVSPEDAFFEEAIDLLLFLEQQVSGCFSDNNPNIGLVLAETTNRLHHAATAARCHAIATVAAELGEMFELVHQSRVSVDATIALLWSEGLDCLQTLLMAFLTSAKIEEVEILQRLRTIAARLQAEVGERASQLKEDRRSSCSVVLPRLEAKKSSICPSLPLSCGDMPSLPLGEHSITLLEPCDAIWQKASTINSGEKNVCDGWKNFSPSVAVEHLEQLNTLVATLLAIHNEQTCQEQQQHRNLRDLLQQVQRLQHLLDNLQEWTQRLAAISNSFSPLAAFRWQQFYRTLDNVVAEASEIASTARHLEQTHHQLQWQLSQQKKLSDYSYQVVKNITTVPLTIALEPLRQLWSPWQSRQDKSARLHLETSQMGVEGILGDRLCALLWHLSYYLLAESIESSQTRQQLGKKSLGTIRIQIYQQENQLIVDGNDDGAGVDLSAVYQMLASKKLFDKQTDCSKLLLEPEIASILCEGAALNLEPELIETCKQLTAIKGSMVIKSQPGCGTTFSLQIPLQPKIAQLIVCQANSQVYAFVADSVEQVCLSQSAQILHTFSGRMLLLSRQQIESKPQPATQEVLVPIHFLSDVIIFPYPISTFATNSLREKLHPCKDKPLLLFRYEDKRCALEVDCIIGKKLAAIQPLEKANAVPAYILGTSILADAQPVVVLDGCLLTKSIRLNP